MKGVNAWTAGGLGVAAAWVVGGVVPPVVAIALGAVTAVLGMQFVDEWPRYALAGTVYALGFGVVVALVGPGGTYRTTPLVSLLGFGGLSAVIVGVRALGRRGVARLGGVVDERYTETVYDAVSAGAGTLSLVWTTIRAHERAARYTGIAGVGTAGFVLNLLGVSIPVPVWFLADGLDATTVAFVGAVVSGFHALSTVSATWRTAKRSATRGSDLGGRAAERTTDAAESAGDAVSRSADAAAERASEAGDATSSLLERAKDRVRRDDS